MNIDAVLQDLGDTLIERKPEVDFESLQLIEELIPRNTIRRPDKIKLRRRLKTVERAVWSQVSSQRLLAIVDSDAEYEFLCYEFYPIVLRHFGIRSVPESLLHQLASRAIGPETFQCFPDTKATLSELKSLGLLLCIVSNALPSAVKQLQFLGLEDLFNCILLSFQVGYLKPSSQIYQIALDRLNVRAERALFVDDRVQFVIGASSINGVGMHALLLDRDGEHSATTLPRIAGLNEITSIIRNCDSQNISTISSSAPMTASLCRGRQSVSLPDRNRFSSTFSRAFRALPLPFRNQAAGN